MLSTSIAGYSQSKLTFETDCESEVNEGNFVYQKFLNLVARSVSDENNIPASFAIGYVVKKINSNRCVVMKSGRVKVTGQSVGLKWLGQSGEMISSISGLKVIKPLGYVDNMGYFYIELQDNAVVKH
jgi:hypothetical protein